MRVLRLTLLGESLLVGSGLHAASAADLKAQMRRATPTGPGDVIATVTVSQSAKGATFKTDLQGLTPGPHGFHVHDNGTCEPST
jgi:Cu-Zn family superoxide dismutase